MLPSIFMFCGAPMQSGHGGLVREQRSGRASARLTGAEKWLGWDPHWADAEGLPGILARTDSTISVANAVACSASS